MSYLALYRRYRPARFDELIGQEHIVQTLVNQIESGRIGHAYLFTGTRGTGKTTAAKIFAKAINCEHPVNGSPCGKCAACKALSDPSNIDVLEIDAASNNGVNEIRELRDNVQFPPVSVKYKVYIVDEVHMLSGAAFNALLKTLEEPPEHAVFILATTEVHKIPATILSRCMRFDFRLVSTERIAELISKIYDEQGKRYEKEALVALAKAGEGSVRDALSVADVAISSGNGVLTYDDVTEILGTSNFDVLSEFVGNLLSGNAGGVLETVDKLASLGKAMGVLMKDVTSLLRDVLVVKTCRDADKILALPSAKLKALQTLAAGTNEQRLLRCLEIFADAENALKYSARQRVIFETAAVKAARPDTDYDFDALLSRIKTLENKLDSANFAATRFEKQADNLRAPANSNPDYIKADGAAAERNANQTKTAHNPAAHNPSVHSSAAHNSAENDSSPVRRAVAAETTEKLKFSDFSESEIKGRLLTGLRKVGSEMLSLIVQNVAVKTSGNTLFLIPTNEEDKAILEKPSSIESVEGALNAFSPFEISVKESAATRNAEAVDEATDNIKKIFGEDIVIIRG